MGAKLVHINYALGGEPVENKSARWNMLQSLLDCGFIGAEEYEQAVVEIRHDEPRCPNCGSYELDTTISVFEGKADSRISCSCGFSLGVRLPENAPQIFSVEDLHKFAEEVAIAAVRDKKPAEKKSVSLVGYDGGIHSDSCDEVKEKGPLRPLYFHF